MFRALTAIIAMAFVVAPPRPSDAASLTVSPISIDVSAPAQSAALTLQNRDAHAVYAQVRVFRWSQPDGVDKLEPTDAVIASPPIVQIEPKGNYVVRLQRVSESEPVGEEAYRLIIDELPDLNRQRNHAVTVLLRYSVPMFFGNADANAVQLQWKIEGETHSTVVAQNTGDKRVQISRLSIKAGPKTLSIAPGLAGYVLGHSAKNWTIPSITATAGAIRLKADSDHGPISVPLAP